MIMAEDKSDHKSGNTPPVFGDITHPLGKRDFTSILGTSILQSKDGYDINSNNEDSQALKRASHAAKCNDDTGNHRGLGLLKCNHGVSQIPISSDRDIFPEKTLPLMAIAKAPNEILQDSDSLDFGEHPIVHAFLDDTSRDSCESSCFMTTTCVPSDRDGYNAVENRGSNVVQSNTLHVCKSGSKDNLATDNDDKAQFSSSTEQNIDIGAGSGSGRNDCSNLNAGIDSIMNCPCSFCRKAAYMLTDLHYQDIKGRIAAVKKSKKETSLMILKNYRNKGSNFHGHENLDRPPSSLENDLTGLWNSLFHHTEDEVLHESTKLHNEFRALHVLREDCKARLDLSEGMFLDPSKSTFNVSGD